MSDRNVIWPVKKSCYNVPIVCFEYVGLGIDLCISCVFVRIKI